VQLKRDPNRVMEDFEMHLRSAFSRIGAASLALVIVASGVSAGAFTPSSHAAGTSITVWYPWSGPDGNQIVNWAKAYTKATGVTVNTVLVSGSGIGTTTAASGKFLAAVKAGQAPDLALYWGQDALPQLASVGAVQPLSAATLKAAGLSMSVYAPAAVQAMTYKGIAYGLPEMTNVREFFWNKDMFKAAGLDPNKPPTTLAQVDVMAAKLTLIKDGKIVQLGFVPWIQQGSIDVYRGLFGASYYDANGNPDLNNPALLKLLTWESTYVSRYGAGPISSFIGSFNTTASQANDPFVKGAVAMMFGGEWQEGFMSQYGPKVHYGVAPMPVLAGKPYPSTFLDGNTWFLPKNANTTEALKFIAWIQDPARNAAGADFVHNIAPVLKAQPLQKLNSDPIFKVALDLGQHAKYIYGAVPSPFGLSVQTVLNTAASAVQNGTASPQDALSTAQSSVMRLINE
jgi:multiple sugar transport system substrate-binding protein